MDSNLNFGQLVRVTRKGMGIKAKELAEMIGVPPKVISNLEVHDKQFEESKIRRLCMILEFDFEDIEHLLEKEIL